MTISALATVPLSTAQAAERRQSQYTSLEHCRVLSAKPDEAGYRRLECGGLGGYRLHLIEADGRDNLVVISPDAAQHSLRLPSTAGGGAFTDLGATVEWRGRTAGGQLRPDALIVRYNVSDNPDQPDRPTSYLLTIRLLGMPCLVGRVEPGPGQNRRAQAIADAPNHCM